MTPPERAAPTSGPSSLIGLAVVVVTSHLMVLPKLASLDGFYHIGHAARYLESGPLDTSFPWATQSVIRTLGADLWWGFHVILMPFAAMGDPGLAAALAALILTAVLAATLYGVLKRAGVRWAGWWAAAGMVAVPNVLYRWVMLRPHVLSMAAAFVVLEALCTGRFRRAGVAAAILTWLHLGLFWMPMGLIGAWLLGQVVLGAVGTGNTVGAGNAVGNDVGAGLVDGRSGARRATQLTRALAGVAWVVGGAMVGWLLRPHPFATVELAWIQIVELFATKGTDQPLGFAVELDPLPLTELFRTSWFFVVLWLLTVGLWWKWTRRGPQADTGRAATVASKEPHVPAHTPLLATSALLCSAVFLALALVSARRAQVEWVGFGLLAIPPILGRAIETAMDRTAGVDRAAVTMIGSRARPRGAGWVALAGAVLLVAHIPWAVYRHSLNARLVAFQPNLLAGASAWLRDNTAEGDVVFHSRWDNFGPLFARNRHNRYVSGMDPIFFYSHDPARYWEYFYLSMDATTEYTCDAFPCDAGVATETHDAIRDHFGARWVVVEPQRNPKLTRYLRGAAGFRLAVDTGREVVFEVMP